MDSTKTETTEKFLFHFNYFKTAQRIKNKQDRCDYYDSVMRYAFFGEFPDLSERKYAVQALAENTIDNIVYAQRKYTAAVENGKRGGRPKKGENKTQEKPVKNQCETSGITSEKPKKEKIKKEGYNISYNHSVSDSPTGGDKSPPPSNPPVDETVEELKEKLYTKIADLQRREREKEEEARRQSLDEEAAEREAENKIRQEKIEMLRNAMKKGEEVDAS